VTHVSLHVQALRKARKRRLKRCVLRELPPENMKRQFSRKYRTMAAATYLRDSGTCCGGRIRAVVESRHYNGAVDSWFCDRLQMLAVHRYQRSATEVHTWCIRVQNTCICEMGQEI